MLFFYPQHQKQTLTTSFSDNIDTLVKHSICDESGTNGESSHAISIMCLMKWPKAEKMDYPQSIVTYSLEQTNHVTTSVWEYSGNI
jgi:hypothetical protein